MTALIRLPLEITYRAAKLGIDVLRAIAGLLEREEEAKAPAPQAPVTVAVPEPAVVVEEPPAPAPEPRHVDSEPELSYQAGPAEDVGAEVRVEAPWEGYDRMRAADIVDRLRVADEATRAVVRLYEQQGKARSSVLAATG
jgi:hypothetical protein